jgi:hypothetical protein
VETGKCSLTLGSAIGIFKSLELSPEYFWQTSLNKKRKSAKRNIVISRDEILALAEHVISDPIVWAKTLAQSLKEICVHHGVSKAVQKNLFTPGNIHFFLNPPDFFQCNLSYPPDIDPAHILEVYRRGGALLPEDTLAYIHYALEPVPEEAVAHLEYVIHHALGANPLTVKLKNLFEIDNLCQANGTIVSMSWSAAELLLIMMSSPQYFRSTRLCILILRWEQHLKIQSGLGHHLQHLRQGVTLL